MAHTSCPNGHDMWNGDGKPVVWAFRVGFFREFMKQRLRIENNKSNCKPMMDVKSFAI